MSGTREPGRQPTGSPANDAPLAIVLGGTGMLGRAFVSELRTRGWRVDAPARTQFDLESGSIALEYSKPNSENFALCRLVVNCAAWTDVDGAEANEERATQVNGHAIETLAEFARSFDRAQLVTFGTDYVFDGRGSAPYPVAAPRAPINAYGRSKAVGEAALEASRADWLHIRTSWLYAPWGKNFVLTIRKLLLEKPSIRVVNDQRGRPTSAEHLARTTLALVDRGAGRHQHVTDGGECTWYEFAKEIGRLAGAPGRVEPCTTAEFPRPAKRPAYSVLDLSRTEALLGPMPDWRDNLADVLRRVGP